jgi:hypothetical protein
MKLLPFTQRTYRSAFSADYIVGQLKKNIGPPEPFFRTGFVFGRTERDEFHGEAEGNAFKIQRIIWYRNAFNPVVEGSVTDTPTGSMITVSMRPTALGLVGMIAFLSGLGLITLTMIVTQVSRGQFDPPSLIILFFWAIFLVMANRGFFSEVQNIDRYFNALCDADN